MELVNLLGHQPIPGCCTRTLVIRALDLTKHHQMICYMDWNAKTSLRGGLTMTFSEDWMSILQPSYRIAFECSLLSMLPSCKGEQCITTIPSNNWAQSLDVAVRQPLSAVLWQTNSEAGQTFQDNIEYHFPSGHLYCSKSHRIGWWERKPIYFMVKTLVSG